MPAYYNEHEPFAAAWLRELMADGLIARGVVDERSIAEVGPGDLVGYTQCHFFAGVGVWSYALRRAGWPDDRPVWTGSCPCQPFSDAGKGEAFHDARHLWPTWFRLIGECRPDVVFGEQVASHPGLAWLDVVSTDLESAGYAVGAADTCAAGVGAPHIRQRLYFVARSDGARFSELRPSHDNNGHHASGHDTHGRSTPNRLADSDRGRRVERESEREAVLGLAGAGRVVGMGDANGGRRRVCGIEEGDGFTAGIAHVEQHEQAGAVADADGSELRGRQLGLHAQDRSGKGAAPVEQRTDVWRDALWLRCSDGKVRPISPEPALFPLAPRTAGRVGVLRGAGNALCGPQAAAFIEAYIDISEQ